MPFWHLNLDVVGKSMKTAPPKEYKNRKMQKLHSIKKKSNDDHHHKHSKCKERTNNNTKTSTHNYLHTYRITWSWPTEVQICHSMYTQLKQSKYYDILNNSQTIIKYCCADKIRLIYQSWQLMSWLRYEPGTSCTQVKCYCFSQLPWFKKWCLDQDTKHTVWLF